MTHDPEAQFTEELAASKSEWVRPDAGPSMAAKLTAEFIGTCVLVTAGLATAFLALPYNSDGTVMVALGFAVSAFVLIIALGHISGAHFNPAVTVGLWASGRFPARDIAPYILAQVAGATLAGAILRGIGNLVPDGVHGAAAVNGISIGWGDHSPWGVDLWVALLAEVVLTGALVAAILSATSVKAPAGQAPFTIALALFLLVLIVIPFTNGALNPARATGTAIFAESWALGQLWAWWAAPLLGGALVGIAYRIFGAPEDLESAAPADAVAAS